MICAWYFSPFLFLYTPLYPVVLSGFQFFFSFWHTLWDVWYFNDCREVNCCWQSVQAMAESSVLGGFQKKVPRQLLHLPRGLPLPDPAEHVSLLLHLGQGPTTIAGFCVLILFTEWTAAGATATTGGCARSFLSRCCICTRNADIPIQL